MGTPIDHFTLVKWRNLHIRMVYTLISARENLRIGVGEQGCALALAWQNVQNCTKVCNFAHFAGAFVSVP